jgi:hypothetical protein
MGGGRWDASTYASTTAHKVASGTSFSYSRTTTSTTPRSSWKAHEDLDPNTVAGSGSPFAGKNIRESRDNAEHPLSLPIVVGFDQTGSMGDIPVTLQKKLAELFGILLRKGYVQDPQVAIAAYGDANNHERVPLQFSQFESDNRIDDNLDKLFLEGNGGGNKGETGQLVWYFAGAHTVHDSLEKRGKKGYLFTIGDEVMLPVPRATLTGYVNNVELEGDLTPEAALALAQEKYEVYHLIILNGASRMQGSEAFYTDLLGDNAIILQDPEAVAETIAMIIGMAEGVVDLDDAVSDLKEIGASDKDIASASTAVAKLGGGRKLGEVVEADAPEDIDETDSGLEKV